MGKRKTGLTIEEHLQLSDQVRLVNNLIESWCFLWGKYPLKGREIRALDALRKYMSELRNVLDNDWHTKITDSIFKQHGHVYYNRYDRLDTMETRKRILDLLPTLVEEDEDDNLS